MFSFLLPKHVKQGRQFVKDARKLLAYKRDLWSTATVEEFEEGIARLDASVKAGGRPAVEEAAVALDKLCAVNVPPVSDSGWKENVEVFLVAIVVALGVRTYFLQPFTIPTGSMFPTLNGIIGYPTQKPAPNLLVQAWDLAVYGRFHVDVVAKDDEQIQSMAEVSRAAIMTYTRVETDKNTYMVHMPLATARDHFGLRPGMRVQRGQPIAQGYQDTGDHVFVDKMSYHFRTPRRGDVFVFNTTGLQTIEYRNNPNSPSQYYIKRLVGEPGDELRIDSPLLLVNGERAKGEAFERVMSMEGGYRGYAFGFPSFLYPHLRAADDPATVPARNYFAMGDNSYHSSDSRDWGPVPEANIMGRGMLVYWPFRPHFGLIR